MLRAHFPRLLPASAIRDLALKFLYPEAQFYWKIIFSDVCLVFLMSAVHKINQGVISGIAVKMTNFHPRRTRTGEG